MNKQYTVLFKFVGKFTTVKVVAQNKRLAIAKAAIELCSLFNADECREITEVKII